MSPVVDAMRQDAEKILREEGYLPHDVAGGLWLRDWPKADVFDLEAWLRSNVPTDNQRG